MTRIILCGCMGAMGSAFAEAAANSEDIQIVAGVDCSPGERSFPVRMTLYGLPECDAVVDFSSPSALPDLLDYCCARGLPLVIASTGHSEEHGRMILRASQTIPVFKSPNLCMGIFVLSELTKRAASALHGFDAEIVETHHRNKADAPSGTALALAELIAESYPHPADIISGRGSGNAKRAEGDIGISSVRCGSALGEHTVIFAGGDELLRISHNVFSRRPYADGAIKALRFIIGKAPGLYGMSELFGQEQQ